LAIENFEKIIIEDINLFDPDKSADTFNFAKTSKILINQIIEKLGPETTSYPYQLVHYAIEHYEPRYFNFLNRLFKDAEIYNELNQEIDLNK
jgi:hypothetical protein